MKHSTFFVVKTLRICMEFAKIAKMPANVSFQRSTKTTLQGIVTRGQPHAMALYCVCIEYRKSCQCTFLKFAYFTVNRRGRDLNKLGWALEKNRCFHINWPKNISSPSTDHHPQARRQQQRSLLLFETKGLFYCIHTFDDHEKHRIAVGFWIGKVTHWWRIL